MVHNQLRQGELGPINHSMERVVEEGTESKVLALAALKFLHNNLISTKLVTRDYDSKVSSHKDVVDAWLGGKKFSVDLLYWHTVSFKLMWKERSKSFHDLANLYLEPAALALADNLDRTTLHQLAVRAGNRCGCPGEGFTMPPEFNPYHQILVIGTNAQADILKTDYPFQRTLEHLGTAEDEARISTGIWVDHNCPEVSTHHSSWSKSDDMYEVLDLEKIGNMNLLFDQDSAVVACRPLPARAGQSVVSFAGLSLRCSIQQDVDKESGDLYERVTFDTLTGVGVDPDKTSVIFS